MAERETIDIFYGLLKALNNDFIKSGVPSPIPMAAIELKYQEAKKGNNFPDDHVPACICGDCMDVRYAANKKHNRESPEGSPKWVTNSRGDKQ